MGIKNQNIGSGKVLGRGRTSARCTRCGNIYPKMFYGKIVERNLYVKGQKALDLGTGAGVFPRNMYTYGVDWAGTDISGNQIEQARKLAGELGQETEYLVTITEDVDYLDGTFDVITACQCFWYFDHERVMSKLACMLKPDGRLLLLYVAWLSYEDNIAGESEKLVLKYSLNWSGAGETIHSTHIPPCVYEASESVHHGEYEIGVPFTRKTWNGKMKSCHGVEASSSPEEVEQWGRKHRAMLEWIVPEEFAVKHYAVMPGLKRE